MKHVIVGLISVLMGSCTTAPVPPRVQKKKMDRPTEAAVSQPLKLSINLNYLELNHDIRQTSEDIFRYEKDPGQDLRIQKYTFFSSQKAQLFYQNRKMNLHQIFQNNVAPYFGVIDLNQICLSHVNTKGEDIRLGFGGLKFYMEFPVTESKILSDCVSDDSKAIVRYEVVLCKNKKRVFELRHYRSTYTVPPEFTVSCR